MTSAQFQNLCTAERHEALDRMTIDQMIEFTETFHPFHGLPGGFGECWRTLALRLAIELREELTRHEHPGPCEYRVDATECPNCPGVTHNLAVWTEPDPTTQALEAIPAADVALSSAAKHWEGG